MTLDDRIELFKKMLSEKEQDDILDETIEAYLDIAKGIIMEIQHPFSDYPNDVDVRYHILQVRIAMQIYSKAGAEGEISHTEGSITRSYSSADVSADLIDKIAPYCGVL